MKKSSYILSAIIILAMLSMWYFIFIDYIAAYNPDGTLQIKVPSAGYSANWSQLEPDGNRLRMSYAPNLDKTKEVILAFELMELEVSPELDMGKYSLMLQDAIVGNYEQDGYTVVGDGGRFPLGRRVNGYRAVQCDNALKNNETGEIYRLTIIFAEQEKHYLLIDILCKEEDYTSDREAVYWKVIDTAKEIVKT